MNTLNTEIKKSNKTSLYNFHKGFGAKLVNFAGYEMPIQYQDGIIQEHLHTRNSIGIFDVSHMGQLKIECGNSIFPYLEKIIPLDFSAIENHQSKYSFLLNDNGGIEDDLIVTKVDTGIKIVLNAACKDNDTKIIKDAIEDKFAAILRDDVSLIAIQGPKAVEAMEKIFKNISKLSFMYGNYFEYNIKKIFITRSGYTGEDGFEVSIKNEDAEKFVQDVMRISDAKLIGLGARDSLRLEAGLCLYGHDIDTTTTPIEGALSWAIPKIKKEKGGFLGDKIILDQIKNKPKKIRVGIKPEGKIIAREGTKIFSNEQKEIGHVTSGGFGPSVNGPIAMGYVDYDHSKEGSKVILKVRENMVQGVVSKLPFYKKSYVKN
jgi:aminomethyltransferase